MATREEVIQAIRNADAAGDSASVRKLGEYLKTIDAPENVQAKPAAVKVGETIKDSLPRQLGLTARYGLEGLGQAAEVFTEPLRQLVTDPLARAVSGAVRPKQLSDLVVQPRPLQGEPLSKAASRFADWIGLPQPQGANERVIGDATRLGFGAMTGAGLLNQAAQKTGGAVKEAVTAMAARPGMSTVSAAGAGGSAGAVREAGGGEWTQAAAGLLGGVAAPLGVGGLLRTGQAAGSALKSLRADPLQLDAQLKVEFGRAGLDWDAFGASVKQQLREDAKKALVSGQPLDPAALRRLADYRAIGATPLVGDITQDPLLLTQQRNLGKQLANTPGFSGVNLPAIDNANARRVLSTLEGASTSADDAFTTGQRVIGSVKAKDAALQARERELYGAARGADGRTLPLDRGGFLNEAFKNLADNNKIAFLPEPIAKVLNQLGAGKVRVNGQDFEVPFDVNSIDQLKTTLATASRGAQDGNTRAAIKAVRDALENVQPRAPQMGGNQLATQAQAQGLRAGDTAASALDAFDAARSFARNRRQWQESAGFIEDALDGATPDQFVKKHILGASVEELGKLRASFGRAPEVLESVKKQLAQHILDRGRADSDTVKFSSAGMNDALKAIGERKLALFFSPDEIQQIKSAVNVGRYMQSQPIGSAVNNSNTAGAMMGRLSSLLEKAAPIPGVGPLVAQPLQTGTLRFQARGLNDLSKGLVPSAANQNPNLVPALTLPALLAAPTFQQ